MLVTLIRHAHALDGEDDARRPLSRRGRQQVRALADFLRSSAAFQPDAIWHSGLVRAEETAALLRRRLKLKAPCAPAPGLAPEDAPHAAAARIDAAGHDRLAVVGHEPHLSGLASLLVTGRAVPPVFAMKKCAALTLEGGGRHWIVRWHVSPEVIA
jgi:phosphohistidine phosphatase